MTIHVKGYLTPEKIAAMTGGSLVCPVETPIAAITTDSRDVPKNALFIAIRGDRFDGNAYVSEAFAKGAICALAERAPQNSAGCTIVVPDTRLALGILARAYRVEIDPLTVAVTGSTGKTTTKEFIYAVLNEKYSTLKTQGNFNNDIGLPMTLLGLSPKNQALVVEMGMSARGEIDYLTNIALPDVAVVTNIGTSHIGLLGSREAIRDAKMEIKNGLSKDGVLLLNGDEPLLAGVEGAFYVGRENKNADCRIENIIEGEKGSAFDLVIRKERFESITVPTLGVHNVMDAAFAWLVGMTAGLGEFEIRRGLMNFRAPGQRQNFYDCNGITIMDDCYNASPESMLASLKVLADTARRHRCRSIAVLGDMLELGDYTVEGHTRVGQAVAANHIDVLITFGKASVKIAESAIASGMNLDNVYQFENEADADALGKALLRIIRPADTVLFKASRGMHLEQFIAYITN